MSHVSKSLLPKVLLFKIYTKSCQCQKKMATELATIDRALRQVAEVGLMANDVD